MAAPGHRWKLWHQPSKMGHNCTTAPRWHVTITYELAGGGKHTKEDKQKDESAHCMMGRQGSSSWATASMHVHAYSCRGHSANTDLAPVNVKVTILKAIWDIAGMSWDLQPSAGIPVQAYCGVPGREGFIRGSTLIIQTEKPTVCVHFSHTIHGWGKKRTANHPECFFKCRIKTCHDQMCVCMWVWVYLCVHSCASQLFQTVASSNPAEPINTERGHH